MKFLKKPDNWFASGEGQHLGDSILSHQAEAGGWPKNTDHCQHPFNSYGWYGFWPNALLDTDYPAWEERMKR